MAPTGKYRRCNSLVFSILDYGDIIYNNFISAASCRLIQTVQNARIRLAYYIPFRIYITTYLNQNYILNMKNRRISHMYGLIYKVIITSIYLENCHLGNFSQYS